MNQFFSFLRKEFYHVFRDPKSLLMLFGLPIIQIVLFGFALTNEIKNAKIVVFDFAKDASSQQIIGQLAANPNFILDRSLASPEQIDKVFKQGNIKMAVVFPRNLHHDLMHTNKAQIQIIADASDPNTANTLTTYITSVIMDYQKTLVVGAEAPYRITTEMRMLYNPELKGATNYVPGVMTLVLMLVCVLMTSVSIVKEKELGTMEILLVSPVNPFLIIIAKAVPYLMVSLVNLAVILSLSVFLLNVEVVGSLPLLVFESTLFIITALALGLLISTGAPNQQAAMLLSLMGMLLPTIMFTGFMFPIENMPYPMQLVTNILPTKWYYIIVKSIMIKGLGLEAIWKETLILVGMTLLLLIQSFRKFKIRLA